MITYILYFLCIFESSLTYINESSSHENNEYWQPRIYNGWPAKLGDVPYQVAFKSQQKKFSRFRTFCGGVIIGPAKLLSAAHCFVKRDKMCDKFCPGSGYLKKKMLSHIYAVAGQLSNEASRPYNGSLEEGQWRRLKRVRYPPRYSFPKMDFAVVFLRRPFVYNDYVNEIPYASTYKNYKGQCVGSGFGRISEKETSDKLLIAHLTLITTKQCSRLHKKDMQQFICIIGYPSDVGRGDSGGPLVCKNTSDPRESSKGIVVGIVSGNAKGIGSFFSRVSHYYKYIERGKSCPQNNTYLHFTFLLNLIYWRFLLF